MSHFTNDRHALYVGWVLGIATRNGLDARPITDDEGNYTDRLAIVLPDLTLTVVVPPPPAEWEFE